MDPTSSSLSLVSLATGSPLWGAVPCISIRQLEVRSILHPDGNISLLCLSFCPLFRETDSDERVANNTSAVNEGNDDQ